MDRLRIFKNLSLIVIFILGLMVVINLGINSTKKCIASSFSYSEKNILANEFECSELSEKILKAGFSHDDIFIEIGEFCSIDEVINSINSLNQINDCTIDMKYPETSSPWDYNKISLYKVSGYEVKSGIVKCYVFEINGKYHLYLQKLYSNNDLFIKTIKNKLAK